MKIVFDTDYVRLQATGDPASEYVWIDQDGDVLGRGADIFVQLKKFGSQSITLKTTTVDGLSDEVTAVDAYDVRIEYVERYKARLDAEIAANGGTYLQSHIDALSAFCSVANRVDPLIVGQGTFWPAIGSTLGLKRLALRDKPKEWNSALVNDFGVSGDMQFFNNPSIVDECVAFNGIDQFGIPDLFNAFLQDGNGIYLGYDATYLLWLHNTVDDFGSDQEIHGWRLNTANLFELYANYVGVDGLMCWLSNQNYTSYLYPDNDRYIGLISQYSSHREKEHYTRFTYGYMGSRYDINQNALSAPSDEERPFTPFNITTRAHVIGAWGNVLALDGSSLPQTYAPTKWAGELISNAALDVDEQKILNQAWVDFHRAIGRSNI